jgi:hypothetical protein
MHNNIPYPDFNISIKTRTREVNSDLGAKPGPARTSQAFLPAPWPLANTAAGAQIGPNRMVCECV